MQLGDKTKHSDIYLLCYYEKIKYNHRFNQNLDYLSMVDKNVKFVYNKNRGKYFFILIYDNDI